MNFRSMTELEKYASSGASMGKTLAIGAGLVAGLRGFDAMESKVNQILDRGKVKRAIAYAKSKNPELRKRSDKELETWMQGIYAIAPKVATSNALAASALVTVDSYNGNFDLATAKVLAEINRGANAERKVDTPLGAFNAASGM